MILKLFTIVILNIIKIIKIMTNQYEYAKSKLHPEQEKLLFNPDLLYASFYRPIGDNYRINLVNVNKNVNINVNDIRINNYVDFNKIVEIEYTNNTECFSIKNYLKLYYSIIFSILHLEIPSTEELDKLIDSILELTIYIFEQVKKKEKIERYSSMYDNFLTEYIKNENNDTNTGNPFSLFIIYGTIDIMNADKPIYDNIKNWILGNKINFNILMLPYSMVMAPINLELILQNISEYKYVDISFLKTIIKQITYLTNNDEYGVISFIFKETQ